MSGPTHATLEDFWQMVWERNVDKIVMVTNLAEGKKVKKKLKTFCFKICINVYNEYMFSLKEIKEIRRYSIMTLD